MKEERLKSQVTKMNESQWCIKKFAYLGKCTQLNPIEKRLLPLLKLLEKNTNLTILEMKNFLEYTKAIKDEEDAKEKRKKKIQEIEAQDRIQQLELTKRENHAKVLGWRVFENMLSTDLLIRGQFMDHMGTTQILDENEQIILKEFLNKKGWL